VGPASEIFTKAFSDRPRSRLSELIDGSGQ
jgi:hypothetical protein